MMRPLAKKEIYSLKYAKQNFCDCYLVASISALTRSKNGRKILGRNIQRDGNNFCVRFNNVYGRSESYLVKQRECDELILMNKYCEPIPVENPHHPIIKAVEVAMNKLLRIHPLKKPIICQIPKCQEDFEYNKVSNFLEMFTGVKPITINESGIRMTLKKDKKYAMWLIDELIRRKDFSFIFGTGLKDILGDLPHCLPVEEIISDNITLYDCRRQVYKTSDFNNAILKYKFICGYFNEML